MFILLHLSLSYVQMSEYPLWWAKHAFCDQSINAHSSVNLFLHAMFNFHDYPNRLRYKPM